MPKDRTFIPNICQAILPYVLDIWSGFPAALDWVPGPRLSQSMDPAGSCGGPIGPRKRRPSQGLTGPSFLMCSPKVAGALSGPRSGALPGTNQEPLEGVRAPDPRRPISPPVRGPRVYESAGKQVASIQIETRNLECEKSLPSVSRVASKLHQLFDTIWTMGTAKP